jgi:hypothetical protein
LRRVHSCCLWIFCQIRRPIRKITKASGISVRTSVARRGLRRFNPKALNATRPAIDPYAELATRNNKIANAIAANSDGSRQATSHDLVIPKRPAEIHPTNGGLVATRSCGVC